MQVNDAQTFVNDPNVTKGVEKGIADVVGADSNWVSAILSEVRRLQSHLPRLLQSGGLVDVQYTITVPANAPAAGVGSASSIQSALEQTDTSALTAAVNSGVASTSTRAFTVVVQKIRAPTSKTPGAAPAPNPAPKPAPDGKGDGVDGGAIVGGVLGSIAVLVLCGFGVFHGRRRMGKWRSNDAEANASLAQARFDPEDNPIFGPASLAQEQVNPEDNPEDNPEGDLDHIPDISSHLGDAFPSELRV